MMSLVGYNFEVVLKGITFAKVEKGLVCYELRDVTRMPGFGQQTKNLGAVIREEELEQELQKQRRQLLKSKTKADEATDWLQQQRELRKTDQEICEEAWGKVPIPHIGWTGWNLWFDGAVRRGGLAAGGIVLKNPTGEVKPQVGFALGGKFTCNEAEYRALIRGLREALNLGIKSLEAQGDSKIICYQIMRRIEVKAQNLVVFHEQAMELLSRF